VNNMKLILIIGLIAALPFLAGASNDDKTKLPDEKKQTDIRTDTQKPMQGTTVSTVKKKVDKPLYKPPRRGSPAGRVGGGTRGVTERESFSLQVLAPDHIGLTIHDQPCLYWYISKPIPYPVELTVIERNAVKPLLEKIINGPDRSGIQFIRLAEHAVHLRRNVPYKWFVTLLIDPSRRSKDILASAMITSVEPPPSLLAKLKVADSSNATYIYAEEGLWYDALEAISRTIDASPTNADFRKQRASLLEQVGLNEVAEFENRQ
jgi:hypothetical protein